MFRIAWQGSKLAILGQLWGRRQNTSINVLSTEVGVPLATDFAPYIIMPRMLDNAQTSVIKNSIAAL